MNQREQFEKWYLKEFGGDHRNLNKDHEGNYQNYITLQLLRTWQAAQAAHIALLREALEFARRSGADWQEVRTALAIQSDDAALREWGARLLEEMAEADARFGPWSLVFSNAKVRGDAPPFGAASLSTDGLGVNFGDDNGMATDRDSTKNRPHDFARLPKLAWQLANDARAVVFARGNQRNMGRAGGL